jgi:hypothetical protein
MPQIQLLPTEEQQIENRLQSIATMKAERRGLTAAILKIVPKAGPKIAELERRHLTDFSEFEAESASESDDVSSILSRPQLFEVEAAANAYYRLLMDLKKLHGEIRAQQENNRRAKLRSDELNEERLRAVEEELRVLRMQVAILMRGRPDDTVSSPRKSPVPVMLGMESNQRSPLTRTAPVGRSGGVRKLG